MGGIITFSGFKVLKSRSDEEGCSRLRWNDLGATLCLPAFLAGRVVGEGLWGGSKDKSNTLLMQCFQSINLHLL